jgi:predicted Zn-dependent protease
LTLHRRPRRVSGQRAASQTQVAGRQVIQKQTISQQREEPGATLQREAETELQTGTELTRKGFFREAIPHLLGARGRVSNEYAATFNLALCYVGSGQYRSAIEVLDRLRRDGHEGFEVENLLAQAYIGSAQPQEALASLQKAALLSPQNEKLYVFVADACMDHKDYALGLKVVAIGLRNLPQSARLHYERAMFLIQLDQIDLAKPEFEMVGKLVPGSEIGYIAAAQQELFKGEILAAVQTAREGVKRGYENPALLTILGEALIRSGVAAGQPEFAEAQTSLENAVVQRPNDPASQIALGSLYLMAGRLEDAIAHLKIAQQLDPGKPSVYASLAKAYQRHGDVQLAQDALATLERFNRDQADRIGSAPGDRKLGYAGEGYAGATVLEEQSAPPHPD